MNSTKEQLIEDIQNLLNSYDDENTTSINPDLLEFMDEKTLISIIDSLLNQKEESKEADSQWLEKFKKYDI
ncbi:hypothetical protein [Sulfurimonas sp.]|uniref:hypothetical protein n=1 Tax=Sulfurimonas sp. TaxID=2022749 RepID=UPI003564C399